MFWEKKEKKNLLDILLYFKLKRAHSEGKQTQAIISHSLQVFPSEDA